MGQINFDFTTVDWKVILAALAILVTVCVALYFQWWRNRKRLSYEILSNVVLISAENEIRDKVEIRYEGEPVKNVRLIVIKLINDGYVPIKKDDFEKSVKFIFPGAKILTAEKVKFQPKNIGTMLAYRDECLEVDPVLFNRKDYVQFKVLLSGYQDMEIDARIVGVSSIGRAKRLINREDIFAIVYPAVGLLVVGIIIDGLSLKPTLIVAIAILIVVTMFVKILIYNNKENMS